MLVPPRQQPSGPVARIASLWRGQPAETDDGSLRGLPARVIPVPLWHTASVGLEMWLSALAHGASQVWVLMTGAEAPQYRSAVRTQMEVAQAILTYGQSTDPASPHANDQMREFSAKRWHTLPFHRDDVVKARVGDPLRLVRP